MWFPWATDSGNLEVSFAFCGFGECVYNIILKVLRTVDIKKTNPLRRRNSSPYELCDPV